MHNHHLFEGGAGFGQLTYVHSRLFAYETLVCVHFDYIATSWCNLGKGGALQDNAGAAVCMVGAALKANVNAKPKS